MKTDEIRAKYLEFFKQRGHSVIASDSLVPTDDPTVLFTPAGMNQFKKQFMGCLTGFSRAVTSQRCLRTDDLDKVGKTDCHHTLFEMLGNFSFGDYFKKDAIRWAWEFLTVELGISPDKLSVSVHKEDEEAYRIWEQEIGIPIASIASLGDKDNFWPADAREKGPNGPCGPCSEIFFDMGSPNKECRNSHCGPGCDCGRYVEVWNLVFTQFNRKEGGILEALPQKNIDTGMGLERISAVMQGVRSNFEIDLFRPLVAAITGACAEGLSASKSEIYAVADHIRAAVFSIYDGILPSNEARGYVVRKLIRKSMLHLRNLGVKRPLLQMLAAETAAVMQRPYPELKTRLSEIESILAAEEQSFNLTLDNSDNVLQEKLGVFQQEPDAGKAGAAAFQLYDTYGIPFELTSSWAQKRGIEISLGAFQNQMNEQRNRSKAGSSMQGDVFSSEQPWLKDIPETVFAGYDSLFTDSRVIKIILAGREVEQAEPGSRVSVILDRTPFYAESGGQVGDTGRMESQGGSLLEVISTNKSDKVILHDCTLSGGILRRGESVRAQVDEQRRLAVARNHTATHLLQAALRQILGQNVRQQGSLVAEDRLRFDFAYPKALSGDELSRVEAAVNAFVLRNARVEKTESSLEDAKQQGALAFFAEKYADKVRVVTVEGVSKELCGGTHLDYTGQIGEFRLTQESSVAQGVRRIEAVTGFNAYALNKEQQEVIRSTAEALGVPVLSLVKEAQKKAARIKELERELSGFRLENARNAAKGILQSAQAFNGVKLVSVILPEADADILRKVSDGLKKDSPEATLFALGGIKGERVFLVLGATADICSRGVNMSKVIAEVAPLIGGSGGGRADFAQAGGNQPGNLEAAIAKFKELAGQIKL